jgi:hypothetical protein
MAYLTTLEVFTPLFKPSLVVVIQNTTHSVLFAVITPIGLLKSTQTNSILRIDSEKICSFEPLGPVSLTIFENKTTTDVIDIDTMPKILAFPNIKPGTTITVKEKHLSK